MARRLVRVLAWAAIPAGFAAELAAARASDLSWPTAVLIAAACTAVLALIAPNPTRRTP
jgi:hypothetical protein